MRSRADCQSCPGAKYQRSRNGSMPRSRSARATGSIARDDPRAHNSLSADLQSGKPGLSSGSILDVSIRVGPIDQDDHGTGRLSKSS